MKDPATVALCVGHSRRLPNGYSEGGAVTHDGKFNEWKFNDFIARHVAAELHDVHGLAAYIVDDYGPRSYGEAMRWLAAELKALGNIRLAVELHFNSSDNPDSGGHEWLYWQHSLKGKLAATELHLAASRKLPGIKARGVKPRGPSDRGAEFLRRTHCPAIIAEPFFGSSPHDWHYVSSRTDSLVSTLAEGIAAAHRRRH